MIISDRINAYRMIVGTSKNLLFVSITVTATFLVNHYFIQDNLVMPGVVPSVLGTALAFFIGFSNNQAYDRWWEARKIWGALVNDSRSWARNLVSFVGGEEAKLMVKRHIAFLYALNNNLRGREIEYNGHLTDNDLQAIVNHSNKHNAILNLQTKDLINLKKSGRIDGFEFIQLNEMLVRFSDEMGKSERIKNTVFPTYLQLLYALLYLDFYHLSYHRFR